MLNWKTEFAYKKGNTYNAIRRRAVVKLNRLVAQGDADRARRVLTAYADAKRHFEGKPPRSQRYVAKKSWLWF